MKYLIICLRENDVFNCVIRGEYDTRTQADGYVDKLKEEDERMNAENCNYKVVPFEIEKYLFA